MFMRCILPRIKILFNGNKRIEQIRTIHIIQLTQYSSFNNTIYCDKSKCCTILSSGSIFLIPHNLNYLMLGRWKHGKKSISKRKQYDSDDEDDDDDNDTDYADAELIVGHNKKAKIMKLTLNSMRIDGIIKAGMGIARNKAETILYEGKLRVNGEKPMKKAVRIKIKDVIDVIHGPSPKNDNFLLVTRLTILNVDIHDEEVFKVEVLREKSLIIENYEDSWQAVS